MVAAGGPRLLLVALHRKRAHGDDGRCRKVGIGLDPPGSLIAVEHGHLNVHQNEVGPVGLGFGHARLTIGGLEHFISRSSEQRAQ